MLYFHDLKGQFTLFQLHLHLKRYMAKYREKMTISSSILQGQTFLITVVNQGINSLNGGFLK